ncbi:LOW QUALITY PROTEIN: golgin subfamily A member 2-like [Talpa occidentalis]|uniref:LOW QUALITY PROTEIN: golgin subfamily A member 2-like n=1 Tax=Talpa occidentalis TaxID=50954 RepID=UPI00188FC09D|nr:LOW QUALITY PROTEIN: golgin subfamily A member 2-like [Talpa occidentalis]
MSGEPRQSRLAEAKRKLRDYQQRNSLGCPAGARKKGKNKRVRRPETPASGSWKSSKDVAQTRLGAWDQAASAVGVCFCSLLTGGSPRKRQDIPQVLVSNLSRSNGAPCGCAPPAETPAGDHNTVCPGVPPPDATLPDGNSTVSTQAVSSTKGLRQLSCQLNGLPAEKQKNQESLDQLEKEKKDHEWKLVREQGALREQLQSHIQTIGILVSEKTELRAALADAQQAARQKAGESEELVGRLQSACLHVGELECMLSAVSTHRRQSDQHNKELIQERDALKLELSENKKANEDLQQCHSELEERLRLLLEEKDTMQARLEDLEKKLEMSELLSKQVEEKHQEVQELQQQQDQYFGHLHQYMTAYQQHVVAYQQLANERDVLQKQVLLNTQLVHQMQHEQEQKKMEVELARQELQETQGRLEAASNQNEQLKAQLKLMAQTGAREEEADKSPLLKLSILDDLDSREAVVAFFNKDLAGVEEEWARLRGQLKGQKQLCWRLAQQAAASDEEPEKMEAPAPRTGGERVSGETHQALQGAMDKLQGLLQKKAALKERVEELELRCIQLSREKDTIGEYIILYTHQIALMRAELREKQQHISQLAQDKEEMKVKLSNMRKLLFRVAVERSEWRAKFQAANQNPAAEPTGAQPAPKEPGDAKGQEPSEVRLAAALRPTQG